MRKTLLMFGTLAAIFVQDARAEGGSVGCNVEGNKTKCEIKVLVSFTNGICKISAPLYVIAHRNQTDKVVMIWRLDNGSGDAPRFQFKQDQGQKGIDVTDPYIGFLEHLGNDDDAQGELKKRRYKWRNLNPDGTKGKEFKYDVNVQHRQGGQWSDCPKADPIIMNWD